MSALQIQRMLKENGRPTAYKTAFYMCHRVRAMLDNDQFGQLMGEVEVDETYLGGKYKQQTSQSRSARMLKAQLDKIPVVGAIARKGNVVCQMIENADKPTLDGFVRKVVQRQG